MSLSYKDRFNKLDNMVQYVSYRFLCSLYVLDLNHRIQFPHFDVETIRKMLSVKTRRKWISEIK